MARASNIRVDNQPVVAGYSDKQKPPVAGGIPDLSFNQKQPELKEKTPSGRANLDYLRGSVSLFRDKSWHSFLTACVATDTLDPRQRLGTVSRQCRR